MIDGFICIDKPAGITSHDVVSRVRRILGTRRVGHTGTLDPFATGVLPVAVNDGTKAIPFLDEGVKRYEAVMRLGLVTDSLDITGTVTAERDWSGVDQAALLDECTRFTGTISQIPPMFSAIKQGGQPLYKLARRGEEVPREPRTVHIHAIELLAFAPPLATIRVSCSRGTYVRSLADDIGRALGCGACLQALRRTASGPFCLDHSCTLGELEELAGRSALAERLITPSQALGHLADIPLLPAGLAAVRYGRAPSWESTAAGQPFEAGVGSLVRLTCDGRLAAVAQLLGEPDVKIVLKRVFMAS